MKTIYLEIKDYLTGTIESKKAGERLPTEAELCEMFDVSRVPVRRAMDQMVREGLVYRKKGKGTFVRNPTTPQSEMTFSVVLPRGNREVPFFASICTGIITKTIEFKINTSIVENGGAVVRGLKNSPEAGILWIAPSGEEIQLLEELRERGYYVLILNRVMRNSHFNYVSTDHRQGARDATLYLIDRGHRKIGFIGRGGINPAFTQRQEGFLDAFRLRGMTSPDEKEGYVDTGALGDFPECRAVLDGMFSGYSPTALFLAAGNFVEPVLSWMEDRNLRIPRDVEITTFDEVPPSREEKESVHEVIQPLKEMGTVAAEQMREILRGKKNMVRIVLSPSCRYKTHDIAARV